MRVLSYSPSVEAYIAASDGYYDISEDIIDCNVGRAENEAATFSIKLQNKNGKYNGKFLPMDRITIYATKREEKHQLLTGYISTVTGFTLYPQDFAISGFCSLYQLQKMNWDIGLLSSQQLLVRTTERFDYQDAGMSAVARKLLTIVGGWRDENIIIDAGCPQEVIDWALELYRAKQTDIEGLQSAISDFYDMLASTNASVSGGSSEAIANRFYSDKDASATQKLVAHNAEINNGTFPCTQNYCAAWVGGIYDASGLGNVYGNAIDYWTNWQGSGGQEKNPPVGSVVVSSGWGEMGSIYGHVGIVLTGGRVADNIGYHRISDSVDAWVSGMNATCRGYNGYIGWVWPNNRDLSAL